MAQMDVKRHHRFSLPCRPVSY